MGCVGAIATATVCVAVFAALVVFVGFVVAVGRHPVTCVRKGELIMSGCTCVCCV